MMPSGTRVVPEDTTLEHRIETALNRALEQQVRGGFYGALGMPGEPCRGLVAVDLEELGAHDVIRLSMADVARIAAVAARGWF